MSTRDWTLVHICADPSCAHDVDTHHEGTYNCLAAKCECKYFREKPPSKQTLADGGPDTPRLRLTKPHADTSCNCRACVEWAVKRFSWG